MSKAILLELAERIEKVSGPDTLLDCEIRAAVEGWKNVGGGHREWPDGRRERYNYGFAKPYSSSLDAAMTLARTPIEAWQMLYAAAEAVNINAGDVELFRAIQAALRTALRARAEMEPSDAR